MLRRSVFRLAVLSAHLDSTSTAAPETCGVAIEVPLRKAKLPPMVVERTSTPGAPRCTLEGPTFEKNASESVLSVAATATTLGAL